MGELRKSLLMSLWFMALTFPLMVIRVNTVEQTLEWRWSRLLWVGIGSFVLSFVWRWALRRKELMAAESIRKRETRFGTLVANPSLRKGCLTALVALFLALPWFVSMYETNIFISFMLYVILGLGLNIIVGMAGLLFLGHAAFYAIGAYSYALLSQHFGIGFWIALPLGGILASLVGVILAFPVLRLRGDYLAIVTLGFG